MICRTCGKETGGAKYCSLMCMPMPEKSSSSNTSVKHPMCEKPSCTFCTPDKRAYNEAEEWKCQGCGVWYPPRYLCSNEETHRLECKGCFLCWLHHERIDDQEQSA